MLPQAEERSILSLLLILIYHRNEVIRRKAPTPKCRCLIHEIAGLESTGDLSQGRVNRGSLSKQSCKGLRAPTDLNSSFVNLFNLERLPIVGNGRISLGRVLYTVGILSPIRSYSEALFDYRRRTGD
jgi:hypothetical protein